ncbi:S-adenosyl-L-methionine-dependent methyltransferases superfamily protein [Actinidia rufa]|uniref:Methyltransferase n=1 Tax=Actinidia rufa TaxID=165716 RepID=A0A7J0DUH2_9ERIC|nr:S-adenosyl-L-methionine-dependent methyltransferases superfamily protein [Actinidia rufa]
MADDFEVGDFDPDVVENWGSGNEAEVVDGGGGAARVVVKKFGLCPVSMREYIPCLDNAEAIRRMNSTEKGERFERHCPKKGQGLKCLVPAPKGYRAPIPWPRSRDESLGTTIGIKGKFESPESHRSDFGGERKPISNSDQIRSAQKWRLSIPPDSSRRDEAPAPNCVKIGRRTSPHAPPEVRLKSLISTEKLFLSFLGIPDSFARITPCGKPRMKDTEGDEQEDDWEDQTMHWTRGTTVAEQTSEFQRATGRGQKKRPEKRSQEGGHRGQEKRRDKKNCPRNKAQDQSSEAATTTMMAVDESDVLLAASADEKSDWISDSGIAYHLCRDREVFSTHVACEGLVRMANDAIVGKGQSRSDEAFEASGGNTQSFQEKQEKLQEKEDWKAIPTEGECPDRRAAVRHRSSGSTVEQEHKEMLWDTCGSLARHEKVQPLQDVHEEAQRRETESMHNDKRDVARTSLFRSRSVAVISPVVHTREERWSHDDLQSDVLCSAPRWGGAGHLSEKVQGTSVWKCIHFMEKWSCPLKGTEEKRRMKRKKKERRGRCSDSSVRESCCGCEEVEDGGHLSSPKSQMVGMYDELMAELIFSALRPIN